MTAKLEMVALLTGSLGQHLTPEGHKDSIEDGARMVKQVGDLSVTTTLVQRPIVTLFTQWTHGDT